MNKQAIYILISLLFWGCAEVNGDDPSEPEIPPVELYTEKLVYQSSEIVEFEVINPTSETVYLKYCGSDLIYSIYVNTDAGWQFERATICPSNMQIEFVGTIRSESSQIIDSIQFNPGNYRYELEYSFSATSSDSEKMYVEFNVR